MRKVAKFGGSSLADADGFRRAAEILKRSPEEYVGVVVSAPGKSSVYDSKITDVLHKAATAARPERMVAYEAVMERFTKIRDDLGIDLSLEEDSAIMQNYAHHGLEYNNAEAFLKSRGEYLNAKLFAAYYGWQFVDAKSFIRFRPMNVSHHRYEESYDEAATRLAFERLAITEPVVVPGFYGLLNTRDSGSIHLFSRGGSDISGAILASMLKVDIYENWTDVPGILIAHPSVVPEAAPQTNMTYAEANELTYNGASVLHPEALLPVRGAGIPVHIRSTFEPDAAGTHISVTIPNGVRSSGAIAGIAGRKGFSIVQVSDPLMSRKIGFLADVLAVFSQYRINVEHIPGGMNTVSVVVESELFHTRRDALLSWFTLRFPDSTVEIHNDLALVCVVGETLYQAPGAAKRVIDAIANAGINIRILDQGANELNIVVGVATDDFEATIRSVYKAFIE